MDQVAETVRLAASVGQSILSATDWLGGIYAIAALVGLLLVGYAAVWWTRRRLLDDRRQQPGVFDLQDLRDLLASGQISQAEYEQLREQMLGQLGMGAGGKDQTSE
jgi:hypothetical protein